MHINNTRQVRAAVFFSPRLKDTMQQWIIINQGTSQQQLGRGSHQILEPDPHSSQHHSYMHTISSYRDCCPQFAPEIWSDGCSLFKLQRVGLIQLLSMNQRSVSVNRKLKTDLQDDISFDKKVARAMQDKRQIISKMFTPRHTHCLPTYRTNHPNQPHPRNNHHSTINRNKPTKQIRLSQQALSSYVQSHNKTPLNCMVHPTKRGAFQDKQRRSDVYCHECAIKMVKNNYRMVGISEESVLLRCFLESQLHLLRDEQARLQRMLDDYYASLTTTLELCYRSFLDNKSTQPPTVTFAQFHPNCSTFARITQSLGKLEEVKFRFANEGDRENKENVGKQVNKVRNSVERKDDKSKKVPIEVRVQINRSFEGSINNLFGSELNRSRENSFCDIRQKGQGKKITNMR